jgi:Uma2 family endonuclease
MSALPEPVWTVEAYLAFERSAPQRHEYLGGKIYAMAGASAAHNLIMGNAYASLHAQLRKRPCTVYPSDMRLKVSRTGLYTYPDISVICGEPQFEDDQHDILLNPTVIIEVLSPSTEMYDRGKKFQHYRTLASLQEYLLIAQDSYRVEHYTRQANDQWLLSDVSGADASILLASIECTLLVADLHEKVVFEPEKPSE